MSDEHSRDIDRDLSADVVDHPVRRHIVKLLAQTEGMGLRYLSILVTREEARRQESSIAEIGIGRMQAEIETHHLPALVDSGVLQYNERTEWASVTPGAEKVIESLLEED